MPESRAFFSMGLETWRVPMSLHADNRRRLVERLRRHSAAGRGIAVLQGGEQPYEYDTDRQLPFLQESFFQYLFGVREPGLSGAVDVASGRAMLFIPRLSQEYAWWMGRIQPPGWFQERYEVDAVHYVDEMAAVLQRLGPERLLLLDGINSDSGRRAQPARFEGIERFETDQGLLHPELVECRVLKSPEEIELLRWVNRISSDAHTEVMRRCRPGMMEYQLESWFLHEVYSRGGCRFTAYTCICGCGPHASVLHYGHQGAPNDGPLGDGDIFLNDSGAEYHGYASDITCSFPVNGRFSADQRAIYEAVLAANRAVQRAMKPGVAWPDMHRLAERVVAERLLAMGLLRGSLEDLLKSHVPALFMPHGLGHLIGLDVHDPGGYPDGTERIDEPGIRALRCGRELKAGMVITVEPGIYFIDALLDPFLADPKTAHHLDADVLARFRGFGGVRIEDDVLVTESGSENLTSVPREVGAVEAAMAEGRERYGAASQEAPRIPATTRG
jgi:Xaa-Pro dipeptidase